MADSGSLLLGALSKAFGNVLKKEIKKDAPEADKKKQKDVKQKKTKKALKKKTEEKSKKESEEKHVIREGENSLITYPNASSYSVFAHVRHLVLQTKLCDTYNSRLSCDSAGETDAEEEEETAKKEEGKKMPVVVGLGVKGVFTIIRDIWHTHPELCLRALKEFLNILQGQSPSGLRDEPRESTDGLFELLMQMVSETGRSDNQLVTELSSVASACLLSLVVALGDTSKMLAALTAMLTAPGDLTVQIPQIFYELQTSVQAVLLGAVMETDWMSQGIPSSCLVEQWPVSLPEGSSLSPDKASEVAIASDGQYLYVHGPFGLLKVGSGYANTKKGFVYETAPDFFAGERGWLGYTGGKLYFFPKGGSADTITVLNPQTLKVETTFELEADCQGPQCLFCDSEGLGQIMAKKEGGYVLRKFTTLCSPLPCVEEKSVQLAQRSVMGVGKAKYVSQESLHSIYKESSEHASCVIASRSFAAVQTESGKLMYTGSGIVFGLTGKETAKGEWKTVELPDKNVKVEHCSCDNAGTFSLIVTDKGVVYFGGLNKKGEAAEPVGARAQPKPMKLKRIAKLKDHHIVKTACSTHASAMISKDGKLFMFGNLDEDLTEKSSGVVTGLLGVPASQVSIGRSHTCVLTQHGTVFTFGNNMYGQCGRNFVPSPNAEAAEQERAEEEESSSDDEDMSSMCEDGAHVWSHDVCMICMFCGYCTGYGPGCCNEGSPGREPGNQCGCGSGDSGCKECGCCRVCAGDKDKWGGAFNLADIPEDFDRIRAIREKKKGKKKEKKDKEKEKAKKEDKAAFGLQLLFGAQASVDESSKQPVSGDEKPADEAKPPAPSTKKPEIVPFPDDLTAMQVDCGTFHTAVLLHSGEVYTFGNGNHGQLGHGNNKVCGHPVKVPLPEPASQIACGDNHTVVLLHSGQIYTFGKHQEGQLGRQKQEDDDDTWNMVPQPVAGFGDHRKAMWIGARGNQTFIAVDESLVSETWISSCKVFSNSEMIGLVPPVREGEPLASGLIMIDRKDLKATRLEGERQQNLTEAAVTIDPEYNILWSYSPDSNKISCFNPITANIEDSAGTILSSSICLPHSKEAQSTRSHLATNLLSCLSTLSTHPPLTIEALAGQGKGKYSKDDFSAVVRFNAHGGGWGYSASSVEAIRFSPDTEVLLGGFGLYGGRGTYNAEIKVFDLGENGGTSETDGTLLASHTESEYNCSRMQTYRVLFDKPVLLSADHWYAAYAAVSSPAGASSDAGSSGQQEVQGADKVMFRFKSSKRSNNGTDVGSGQIPEIIYRIPEIEKETGVPILLLDKTFSSSVSPDGLKALLSLLEWSWSQLSQLPSSALAHDIQHHTFIAKSAVELLKTYIQETYPKKGKMSKPALDCPELAESVYEARSLLISILSTRRHPLLGGKSEGEERHSLMSMVTEVCCKAFQTCFHAFYPTTPLKWFALCQQLQHFDPHDIVEGVPNEHLLSSLLDALADPTVSYIGLGYDSTVGVSTAIYNSEPNSTFPILSEYMQMKTLEENEGGELLGFSAVATKLLGVVTAPIQSALNSTQPQLQVSPVVSKAGNLLQSRINELALCIAYPDSVQKSGLSLSRAEKKDQKVVESSLRFSTKECGYPSLEVTDVSFSVNQPVLLHGVTLYGGTDASYKYKVVLYHQADPPKSLAETEGTFSQSDYYGESFVNVKFKRPIKLEAELVYTAHVQLTGEVYDVGVEGKTTLTGPGGVTFTLHHTGLSESNPETGPLVKFLYSQMSASSGPQNVVQMSVHLASTLLNVMVGFLERAMREGLSSHILELLGSSFLYSTLLPTTLAQLGPVACKQPKYSVEVVDLVKRVLPIVSAAVQSVTEGNEDSTTYSDTKLLHYATVETEHPYKPASVSHYKVKFSSKVQWMSLEFDSRCGFSQSEDKIGDLLIPRCNGLTSTASQSSSKQSNNQQATVTPFVDVSFDDLYTDWDRYALTVPPGVVLLPGNEVHIVVNTDTEYDKKDINNHFGLKCQVVGYEWTDKPSDCLLLLEKELVSLGAMCAASMLKESTILPFAEELSVSVNPDDPDKADMRIVQASAQEVLSQHSQVLNRGLMVERQTINNILNGDIPPVTSSSEQLFLKDFMESKGETPGGRLARWLQPDRAVDLEASELTLPTEEVKVGAASDFTVFTKDQDGKLVFVDGMKVEVKALWLGHREGEGTVSIRKTKVDRVTGVKKPLFKKQYHATRLNSNYLYHSISMMMHYQDYSFEELRLFAPKVEKSSENVPLKSNEDGSYVASWVPSVSGRYLIQVYIDGKSAGREKALEVSEPESPEGEDEVEDEKEEEREREAGEAAGAEEDRPEAAEEIQELPESCKPKMKLFTGKLAAGLRIRAEPSFMAVSVGVIKPGESFTYSNEVENSSGKWVVLTSDAMQQFGCPPGTKSAYALAYSTEKEQEFLEDKEPPPELIEIVKKKFTLSTTKKPVSKKRRGGPGNYEVVQCGSAGHNVRSKPGLKGTPVGRLTKGGKIEALEEVENDDGIWLKLSKDSAKKFCDTESEAWTLAVGPSGRIFLAIEGDDSYLSQIVDSSSKPMKPTLFPTAAAVFGTSNQSVFGTPIADIPSAFSFGSSKPVKLQFGGAKAEKVEFKGAALSPPFKFGLKVKKPIEESGKGDKQGKQEDKPLFSIGISGIPKPPPLPVRRARRRSKNSPPAEEPKKGNKEDEKEEQEEEKSKEERKPVETPSQQPPNILSGIGPKKQALSPAMAECQRAVFAAFLWQEGLVHDAIVSASYLKFHPELSKEHSHDPIEKKKEKEAESAKDEKNEEEVAEQGKEEEASSDTKEAEKQPEVKEKQAVSTPTEAKPSAESGPVLPPTLNHLVTFWDEISTKVVENSALPFPSPKVPALAQELQKRYEEERKEIEKRRKEKDKKAAAPGGGGGGSTMCELCDGSFPDPVTYHMKDVHPGCGKHASGWGYNSRGTFCSGWAGNCGDGGRGGSTWYLMCKDCHAKYLATKDEMKKKSVKTIPLPKMKTRKPGKPRTLPVISSVQGMIQNAKFLLEISRSCDSTPTTPAGKPPAISELLTGGADFTRQISSPADERTNSLSNLPPVPSLGKTQSDLSSTSSLQRPSYLRSYSIATGTASKEVAKRPQSESDETPSPVMRQSTIDDVLASSADSQDSSLMVKPSRNLRQLMYNRSRQGPNSKETGYKRVMAFVLRYHDLDGLRATMKQAMRVAGIRHFALEFLEWLLLKVTEPSIIHDVIWQFNCALSEHPVQQMAAKMKAEGKGQKNSKNGESDEMLGKHPLSGLDGAGTMLSLLRKQFHSLLQTTADIMPKLPMGSAAQQAALQCYCLQFKPQDHSFLLQSNVFTNISKALSLTEESQDSSTQEKKMRDRDVDVILMEELPIKGKVTASSNPAMINSLTDGSTETFWESRDEPRGKPRQLTVTFDKEMKVFGVSLHIDNQKDAGQRVESLALNVGRDDDSLKEVDQTPLLMLHSGWKTLMAPEGTVCSVIRVEVKGLQNNVRVRQIQVLGIPVKTLDSTLPAVMAQQKACEGEALRVFRLLTSQVFGGLLTAKPDEEGQDETDSPAPPEGEKESAKPEDEVREHVVDFLSCQGKLSGLQKQVCTHIVQSVHTEMQRMKEEWEATSSKPPPPKPSRQTSIEPSPSEGGVADTYCYELLSMLIGLSQSEVGCAFLSEQDKLMKDLFTLLHVATVRIQLQVCTLLRKILPDISPKNLATMLGVKVLPPLGYSAIAEAVNSAATINQLGILDCLLAVIAKALSVQVKAKGRSTNILQLLTGENSITALSLACLVNPKPVPGETTVKAQRWYLKGGVSQEVASEVVKLLKDMITGSLGNAWEGYSKSAVGQAVLHLTKVNEEARVPVPGMYSQTLWLCLAALCVIDKEHAEALSSGQWLGQDGKPKTKPLCDNHDDGETQALILCEKCGNLCGECDRVLHYRRATKAHQRQVFKEEEEAVKVELHEGCGRIKLYWTMALADFRTLKGMVEFREAGSGGGKGSCRFCGTTANTSLLSIGNVCTDPECLERADLVCDKTLSCGHACCGVKGEEKCLSCLYGCAGDDSKLKQDADDMCMMCYTEGLSCAACIQLECGHLFHYHCCRNALTTRWSGPRILFRFMFCSLCTNTVIAHAKLADVLDPVMDLYEDVKRKCLMRLEYENLMKSEAITSPTSKFYQKPLDYAMWKYAYYVCHKCNKAYYGGEANCAEQLAASDDYDPTELVCPACANVGGGALQVCPKHGTDFLEYKCRYCCSVAVYFCFGTTHFCNPCHDDFQRLTGMAKAELPQCPVGPCAKPLEGTECPLHVKHPPTGEEFALGCGVCRNAQTF